MKKTLLVLLILSMLFAVFACSKKQDASASAEASSQFSTNTEIVQPREEDLQGYGNGTTAASSGDKTGEEANDTSTSTTKKQQSTTKNSGGKDNTGKQDTTEETVTAGRYDTPIVPLG